MKPVKETTSYIILQDFEGYEGRDDISIFKKGDIITDIEPVIGNKEWVRGKIKGVYSELKLIPIVDIMDNGVTKAYFQELNTQKTPYNINIKIIQ